MRPANSGSWRHLAISNGAGRSVVRRQNRDKSLGRDSLADDGSPGVHGGGSEVRWAGGCFRHRRLSAQIFKGPTKRPFKYCSKDISKNASCIQRIVLEKKSPLAVVYFPTPSPAQYRRRYNVSLPCSGWERVGPLRSNHQGTVHK